MFLTLLLLINTNVQSYFVKNSFVSSRETKIQRAIQCNANERGGSTINWVKISGEDQLGSHTSITGTFSASSLIDYIGDFTAGFDGNGNLISVRFKSPFENDWVKVREDCLGSSTNQNSSELNSMITNELILKLESEVKDGIQCNATRRGGSKIKSVKIVDYDLLSSGRLEFNGVFTAENFFSYKGQFKSSIDVRSRDFLYMKFTSTYESSWIDIDRDCY